MSMNKWELSVRAWNNVMRIEPEDGEARANLGATFTKMGLWNQAYHAFDAASKREYENWRVWENKLFCAARTGRYADAMAAQKRVVELRKKRKGATMDWMILEKMTVAIIGSALYGIQEKKKTEQEQKEKKKKSVDVVASENIVLISNSNENGNVLSMVVPNGDEDEIKEIEKEEKEKTGKDSMADKVSRSDGNMNGDLNTALETDILDADGLSSSRHLSRLLALCAFTIEHVPSSHQVWECYGDAAQVTGDAAKVLECREKAFRSLERGDWIEDSQASERIVNAAIKLHSVYVAMQDKHRGRLVIKSMVDKLEARGKEVKESSSRNGESERVAVEKDRLWRSALIEKLVNVE